MNTVLARPEDAGITKIYMGYLFLVVAMIDSFLIIKLIIRSKRSRISSEGN